MKISERKKLERFLLRLKVVIDDLNALAEEIEGYVMKQTTQKSNEWFGGANC